MVDILDEQDVRPDSVLDEFPEWDSLAVLSVAALAEEKLGHTINSNAIKSARTVFDLFQLFKPQ